MKEKFHIMSDGSCDLTEEEAVRKQVTIIPFYVAFQEEPYQKNVRIRDFYRRLVDAPEAALKSKAPTSQDFADAFLPYVKQGIPVLCICMSGRLSPSVRHARKARTALLMRYPKARIGVVDSKMSAGLQGLFVSEAVRLRDEQVSLKTAVRALRETRNNGRLFFTSGRLTYTKNKRKASIRRSITELVDYLKKQKAAPKDFTMGIGYGYNYGEAANFRSDLVAKLRRAGFEITEKDIPIRRAAAVTGAHVGPFPLGVAVLRKTNSMIS